MPFSRTFTGLAWVTTLNLYAVVRLTPDQHEPGTSPSIPPIGCKVPIATGSMRVTVEVLAADPDLLVVQAGRKLWRLRPLQPNEIDLTISYPEGSGATDWIIVG